MIKNIDHIAIKVSNLSRVCRTFNVLGIPLEGIKKFPEVGMEIAFLGGKKGQIGMELMTVTDSSSPIDKDPPGFHHVGLKVADIEAAFSKIKASDLFNVEGAIKQGAHARIFFFRLKAQEEILFECVEEVEED